MANVGYENTVEFAKRIRMLRNKGMLHVIPVAEDMENAAWIIFERYNKDKFWSFTDCTSKAIMETLSIEERFSFDKNFEQMGFLKRP